MNKTILMGRMTADPVMRSTQSGKSVCDFSIAVDDGYGEQKYTSFINCTAWQKTAEAIHKFVTKGQRILICGRLRQEKWEKDDRKYSVVKIIVEEFNFVEGKKSEYPQSEITPINDEIIPF